MNTINNIHNTILKEIKNGSIRQKPKWRFFLITTMVIFGVIAFSLILLYLVSFIGLVLREHLLFEALRFGPGTVFAIMHTLPFLLVLLVVTVLLILRVLVQHFAFVYTKSMVVTLGAGLLLTLFLFSIVLITDKESKIARLGERGNVPGAQMFNDRFRERKPPLALRGVLKTIDEKTYTIEDGKGKQTSFVIGERTRIKESEYKIGDELEVLVKRDEEILRAIAVRLYDETKAFSHPSKVKRAP